jgi:hypothetical protein
MQLSKNKPINAVLLITATWLNKNVCVSRSMKSPYMRSSRDNPLTIITAYRDRRGMTTRNSSTRCVMSQPSNCAPKSDSLGAWFVCGIICKTPLKIDWSYYVELCTLTNYEFRETQDFLSATAFDWVEKIYSILIIRIKHHVAIASKAFCLLSSGQIKLVYLINTNYQQHNRLPTSHNHCYIFKKTLFTWHFKNISPTPE